MFSTFVAKFRPNFAERPNFFGKNATKFFFEIFSIFFFVDCQVWNLRFQTHSDSLKNIKNSLFYGILKVFCHSWLRPKNGHFGLKPLLLGLKSPKKWFPRCNFKIAVAREFSIFVAKKQHLLLNFGRISLRNQLFSEKTLQKLFFNFF